MTVYAIVCRNIPCFRVYTTVSADDCDVIPVAAPPLNIYFNGLEQCTKDSWQKQKQVQMQRNALLLHHI